MSDAAAALQQVVTQASADRSALHLRGSGSKCFLGNPVQGQVLDLKQHHGVVSYEPTELVLTARGGTPLAEVEDLLRESGQHLSFDPPRFQGEGTLGGAIGAGLGGPGRPWGGAPRDVLLGVKLLDGRGQIMRFGGEVMKNVAGYDISRLMAGALGTLGILLEVSLKVLPGPVERDTRVLEMNRGRAIARLRELCRQAIPLDGACHYNGQLYLRLSGSHASIKAWRQRIGGEALAEHSTFWQRLRDHELSYFRQQDTTLWRLSLPPATASLECEQDSLLDWAGAQRWLMSSLPAEQIREQVRISGGHAEVFRRGRDETTPFQVMPEPLLALHRRLKQRFDPHGILNPGRLFNA